MTYQMTHRGRGLIAQGAGAAIAALQARAAAWEAPLKQIDDRLIMYVWGSELRLTPQGHSLLVELLAPESRLVGTLRDCATELFAEVGLRVDWSDVEIGALAPGLSLMRVTSVTCPSPSFIRVRLTGPEAARFASGGLHFRLILPPFGREPVWPRVAASGRTVWPEGGDALHRPVYTVLDQQDDWVDFDIFRHTGSPTCAWAEGNPTGTIVGMMGPGGGTCPDAERLYLYGDETALPAIQRMLRLARGEVCAHVRIAPAELASLTAGDPRVRSTGDLLDQLRAQTDLDAGSFTWFAAGSESAQSARSLLREAGIDRKRFSVASYWG
ncbi:MAG: siderophore-interacting protein [Paracoccus denitrificans]|uniref:Siderophore-interacting protein n=1 Tax=Paracoccus denitrificans TaxID=266 RepID=A0A533I624_PARDE|nr:MAG: siderophore-interacting protein [Paracoccus denitrificans]